VSRPLPLAVGAWIAVSVVALVVSIRDRLPARFGQGWVGSLALDGSPAHVLRDSFVIGTALAPPVVLLVAVAVLAVLRRRWAATALAIFGPLAIVAYLGEPEGRRLLVSDWRGALVALGIACCAAIAAAAATELHAATLKARTA
jgi:hypothetical protein